jgi:hypothetical protein
MLISGADGAGEAVLFAVSGYSHTVRPRFFVVVVGSFLEPIVPFHAHQSSLLYLYCSLLHANKHSYRYESYLNWSKLYVSDTLMMSKLDTEILIILTVIVNRQKHELIKEQDQFSWLMKKKKASKADWVYISNCHRL